MKKRIVLLPFKRFLFFKFPDGWEDKGQIGPHLEKGRNLWFTHAACGSIFHIGVDKKDRTKIFQFCPRCEVILRLIE